MPGEVAKGVAPGGGSWGTRRVEGVARGGARCWEGGGRGYQGGRRCWGMGAGERVARKMCRGRGLPLGLGCKIIETRMKSFLSVWLSNVGALRLILAMETSRVNAEENPIAKVCYNDGLLRNLIDGESVHRTLPHSKKISGIPWSIKVQFQHRLCICKQFFF